MPADCTTPPTSRAWARNCLNAARRLERCACGGKFPGHGPDTVAALRAEARGIFLAHARRTVLRTCGPAFLRDHAAASAS